jgi:CBS domain-containing protein
MHRGNIVVGIDRLPSSEHAVTRTAEESRLRHRGLTGTIPVLARHCPCPVAVVGAAADVRYVDPSTTATRKKRAVAVRDLMSSPAVTIRPDEEVAEAARLLDRLSLTSLPVVDHDLRLLGILSEADVVALLATAPHLAVQSAYVGRLMTRRVLSVAPDDDLTYVIGLMTGTVLKSLPVLLRDRVVGMVSRRDIVRAFAQGDLDACPIDQLSST